MRDHPACQVRYLWLPKASAARPAVAIDVFGSLQAWLFVWQARGETTHMRRGSMILARIYACSLADSAIYAELNTVGRVTSTLTLLHYRPLFELQFINQFGLSSIDWLITRLDLIDSLVINQSINQSSKKLIVHTSVEDMVYCNASSFTEDRRQKLQSIQEHSHPL